MSSSHPYRLTAANAIFVNENIKLMKARGQWAKKYEKKVIEETRCNFRAWLRTAQKDFFNPKFPNYTGFRIWNVFSALLILTGVQTYRPVHTGLRAAN